MATKLTLDLMQGNFDEVLDGIEKYEKWLNAKCTELSEKVAERIQKQARLYAALCTWYARDIKGGTDVFYKANIDITVSPGENGIFLVIANGQDAVWAEFGTGVYYNSPVGTSPNPLVENTKPSLTIGSWGKNGGKELWTYTEENDKRPLRTHGIEATMPLYNAQKDISFEIGNIAREVFGSD